MKQRAGDDGPAVSKAAPVERRRAGSLALAALLTVPLFILDILTPHGYAAGFLYVFPLLLALQAGGKRAYYYATGFFIVLSLVSGALKPASETISSIYFNRSLMVLTFLLTAFLTFRRAQADAALRLFSARLNAFFDNAPTILDILDGQYHLVKVDRNVVSRYGLEAPGDIIGKPVFDFAPLDREKTEKLFRRVLEHGESFLNADEMTITRAPGGARYWQMSYFPVPLEDGKRGIGIVGTDITDRKKAEEARKNSEERLRAIVDNLAEGLVVVDPRGGILSWNPAALKMHGYERQEGELEFLGKVGEYFELHTLDGKYIPFEQWPINRMLRGEHFRNYEIYLRNREQGWQRAFTYNGTLVRDRDGSPLMGFLSIRDVTERREAEEALKDSETRLKAIVDNLAEGLVVLDPKGGILNWNHAALKMHGYERRESELEFLSKLTEIFELSTLDGELVPFEQWPASRLLHGEDFRDLELYVRNKRQGGKRIFSYNGTLIRGLGGQKPALGFISIRDITERRGAEEALRESEERFRTMANAMPQLAWMARPDGYIYWYNRRWYEYTGTTPGQMEGWGWQNVHDPKVLPQVLERWKASIATGKPFEMEFPLRGADGVFRSFLTRVEPLKDRNGSIVQWLGTNTDIAPLRAVQKQLAEALETARRRAEEAEEGNRVLNALMDNIPEVILVTDAQGSIRSVSRYLARISGHDKQEVLGKNYRVVDELLGEPPGLVERRKEGRGEARAAGAVVAETPLAVKYPLERALGRGEVTVGEEHQVYLRGGAVRTVVLNAAPVRDAEGRAIGAVSSWLDITDRKKAEEAMKASNRELEQFAYVASHDLQEPLRMVASFTELLERRYKDKFDPRGREYLGFIIDGATRMQHLIQDLLAYSRVGRLDTGRSRVDCNVIVDAVIRNLSETIRETGAEVTRDRLPALSANETTFVRLFQNLISNAIKFRKKDTPPRVHVGSKKRDGEWLFSVSDNGIGIEPRHRGKLFIIFQRLHSRQEYPGTGMGLAISKKIVETYGGRIWVESEPGKGSTFYFTIPA